MKHLIPLSGIALAVALTLPIGSTSLALASQAERTPANASASLSISEQAREAFAYQTGMQAYTWGWPAVSLHNRRNAMLKVPVPGLVGGILPVAPINRLGMLTDYLEAAQRYVLTPNQDVVYGQTFLDLSKEPVIVQVPDFGARYWVLHCMDAYTEVFAAPSSRVHSKPGFYLVVGPDWQGEKPAGVVEVLRAPTNLAWLVPRIFMDDTATDREAIQPLLSQMNAYPLSEFDGQVKPVNWRALPKFPAPPQGKGEVRWVKDESFWSDLGAVLAENQPRPGEAGMVEGFKRVLEQAKSDPVVQRGLERALLDGSRLLDAGFSYSIQPDKFGNHWAADLSAGAFGSNYLRRAWVAKAYIATNKPDDALYIGTDYDGKGARLQGAQRYSLTFPAGQLPPAEDFWSLSAYDGDHFFAPNAINRFSIGTKNKNLQKNADGSLTLYVQHDSPGADKESNWLPVPAERFSLLLRLYSPSKRVVEGGYQMPAVVEAH
ncbi:DUF1254 domain-containing protein [Aquipseudomonas alcaligenes]|uniref:DUF1254 domain-containing protein n=1 Tax=Aquipseudomonas alcaligenes TaxID=43263 RepID=UPI00374A37AC